MCNPHALRLAINRKLKNPAIRNDLRRVEDVRRWAEIAHARQNAR
jgi:hypothetical protein